MMTDYSYLKINKPLTSTSKAMLGSPYELRHVVEEREEKWRNFREERKAV